MQTLYISTPLHQHIPKIYSQLVVLEIGNMHLGKMARLSSMSSPGATWILWYSEKITACRELLVL